MGGPVKESIGLIIPPEAPFIFGSSTIYTLWRLALPLVSKTLSSLAVV